MAAAPPVGGDMIQRILRHLVASAWRTRQIFSAPVLDEIERAIGETEAAHSGEIRFAVETALPITTIWQGCTARHRAGQVFGLLRVWDTSQRNGVLIYVLRADRAVEIIVDRAIGARVQPEEWAGVCRQVESHYRSGNYLEGSRVAVAGVGQLLGQHFPPGGSPQNELPNRPVLL